MAAQHPQALIIACGALAREVTLLCRINHWDHFKLQCIPAKIHNTPDKIPAAIEAIVERAKSSYPRIYVAFADCGTGGALDRLLHRLQIERLPGAHCYEFYAGSELFHQIADSEPGTFYLSDFLARHFERLILDEMGIDKHPQLLEMYFGNYRQLVYLAQTKDQQLKQKAQAAAERLGLSYEYRFCGYGDLQTAIAGWHESTIRWADAR